MFVYRAAELDAKQNLVPKASTAKTVDCALENDNDLVKVLTPKENAWAKV
jgi:hypothetical protein